VSTANAKILEGSQVFTIPPFSLPAYSEFTFSLTAENFLGISTTIQFTVKTVGYTVLTASILNKENTDILHRNDSITLQAEASIQTCNGGISEIKEGKVKYSWSVIEPENNIQQEFLLETVPVPGPLKPLVIPSFFFKTNVMPSIKFTAISEEED
jgi:hypothetical protein